MKVRELKAIINERISLIKQSNRSFKDIFNCVHYQENNTFSEELDGFKIVKTTYKEAKMSSILMGHYFDTNISLPKGSYVGLMMENKKEWIFSFWGLLMAGFKPVLLNTRLGLTLNKDVVKLLDLKMIVSDQEIGLTNDEININKIKLEETDRTIDDFIWENEIALTTSATTLNIKICVYKGENIAAQILNTDRIISENTLILKHYNKELKQLAFLPFYHVFGLIATYFWFAFFSRTFVFLKDYSIDTILNTIKRHKVTHVFAVPLLWHGIHKEIIKQVNQKGKKTKKKFDRAIKFSIFIQRIFPRWGLKLARKMFKEVNNKLFGDSVYFSITGGSYISPETLRVINAIGYPLFNGYGMSEIGIVSVELRKCIRHRLKGSIGKPFESVEYKLEDDVLFVRGRSLASKTITNEGVTILEEGKWFNTKDIAYKDKKHYYLKGREDDIVISPSGEKYNPDMIEKEIYFQTINRFTITGVSEDDNYYLSLIVEVEKDLHQLGVKKVIEEIESNLKSLQKNKYNIEKVFITYDPIAAPTAIKVSRTILHQLIKEGKVNLIPYNKLKKAEVKDVSELNKAVIDEVIKVIAEVTNKEKDNIKFNSHFFFDIGGTSLEYLTLLVKLKEKHQIEFDFLHNGGLDTAERLADYIIKHI